MKLFAVTTEYAVGGDGRLTVDYFEYVVSAVYADIPPKMYPHSDIKKVVEVDITLPLDEILKKFDIQVVK